MAMADKREPPPGGGGSTTGHPRPPASIQSSTTTTPEQLGGSSDATPRRMRTFEEIIAYEKENRNILTVKLAKIVTFVNGEEVRERNLNIEDIGELFFDVVKLKVEDCAGLSLSTNRYDTKEINLKPGVDPTP